MAELDEQWEPTDDEQGGISEPEDLVEVIDDDDDHDEPAPEAKEKDDEAELGSDRVQKRIDQLTRQRHDAERREADAETRLTAIQDKMNSIESGMDDQRVNNFQQKYDNVKEELFEAAETGDTKRQVELTEQMADMRATARIAQMRRKEQESEPAPKAAPSNDAAPQEAYAWWAKNKWFDSSEHAPETMFAKSIDNQLESEGLDKNTPEYYDELDSRLQKRFPELYSKAAKKPKPPVAPSGGRGSGKQSKDGRIRMTAQELQIAKDLDITSEEGLREYAKELKLNRSN